MKALRTSSFIVLALMNFFCTGLHAGAEGVSLKLSTKSGETLQVWLSKTDEARITNYPPFARAEVSIQLIQSPFEFTELSAASCSTIREKAKRLVHSSLPASVKKQLLSGIRELSTVKVDFKFNDFISQSWLKSELKRAATASGIETNSIEIVNPLELTQLNVLLEPNENSISNLLGEDALLQKQLESLFTTNAVHWGSVSREFSQLDFLCDLVEGNMQLSLQVQGEEKNTPVYAEIIPFSLARGLTNHLLENTKVFLKDRAPFSFPRNYMKAGIIAERFWKSTGQKDVPLFLWSKMLEQLLDAETGIPKELSDRELAVHSRYVVKNHSPYTSKISFKTIEPGEPK